ncbi:MAG: hypothetical protein RMI94_00475 [Bryobacterales bacterium]|nr:hypothetical protein [Bryobacteraceae bacterium]MDW8128995.1 hypothetical protein [Bryobacterales bacterium]
MRTWRVAVIGRTGRGCYGRGLDTVGKLAPNVRIGAAPNEDPAGLRKVVERLGAAAAYLDCPEMLRRERPDVVSLAPPWADCQGLVLGKTAAP